MRRLIALLAVLMLAWHGAVPGQTPNAPPARETPTATGEQTPVEAPAAPALGAGLSMSTLAVLGIIGVIVLTTITPATSCDDSISCGPNPITGTATGTR